jgi:hypothetical protein
MTYEQAIEMNECVGQALGALEREARIAKRKARRLEQELEASRRTSLDFAKQGVELRLTIREALDLIGHGDTEAACLRLLEVLGD